MTAEELQTKRDALVSAIAAGTLELVSGDKSIRYQSIEQMQAALSTIDRELAKAGGSVPVRTILVQHSRG